jgi:hypothetical protein
MEIAVFEIHQEEAARIRGAIVEIVEHIFFGES